MDIPPYNKVSTVNQKLDHMVDKLACKQDGEVLFPRELAYICAHIISRSNLTPVAVMASLKSVCVIGFFKTHVFIVGGGKSAI